MIGMSFAGLLMMLLGGGANDLLDMVHSDSYWKAKQVTVSFEQLIADAAGKAPGDVDPGAPQAANVRRLMAIRTLGERKQAEAVPALKSLEDSKDPFVADYAKSALAAIEGKPILRPGASAKDRMADVWLLPAQCDLVAQVATAGKSMSVGNIVEGMPFPPGTNKEQMLERMTAELLPFVEMIGNVRLQSVTVGLYSNVPGQPGYAVIVARGQYDAKAVAALLGKKEIPSTTVDGLEVFQVDKSGSAILVSDARAVMVTADHNGTPPLEAVVTAIKKDAGGLHDNAEITRLIASVDTTQSIWGVVKMTDGLRQEITPLAPFDTGTLVVSQKEDVLSFSLKAEGSDAEKVKAAVEQATAQLQEGLAQGRKAVQTFPEAKPMVEAMESIKLENEGGKATASGSIKGPMSLLTAMWGARAQAGPVAPPATIQGGKPGGL